MTAIDDARRHLSDDGALRWTVDTREQYLVRSHDLLVAVINGISQTCRHYSRTHNTGGWHCPDCGMRGPAQLNP